jgi:hypothetical protein
MEPLPSYQQFLIVGFRGYESCTRCMAMPRLDHTYTYPFLLRSDYPALPGYLFIPRSIVAVNISVVTEPLPSYQQFPIVGFRGYESCTRCLATARLDHTYFLRYFGPLGRMSRFSMLILFLILIQSGKRGKWNYTIHRKIVMPEHTYIHAYIHSLLYR